MMESKGVSCDRRTSLLGRSARCPLVSYDSKYSICFLLKLKWFIFR